MKNDSIHKLMIDILQQWQYRGKLREDGDQSLFTKDDADNIAKRIQKKINAAQIKCKPDASYGKYRSNITIFLSLDKKSQWQNNIYQNSRYSTFILYSDGQLMQLSKDYKFKQNFRKSRVVSVEDAIKRINKYIEIIQQ